MSDTPECRECNRPYQIRPDSEPTDYCDECAHLIVSKLETALSDANEELESSRTELANLQVCADGLKAEIDRLRSTLEAVLECVLQNSRAKRVTEGK